MTQLNTSGFQIFIGVNAGIQEQLDRIGQQAIALRDEAATGMKRCRDELAKELISLDS
jgi:hypothetical protein